MRHVPDGILLRATVQHFLQSVPDTQGDISGISEQEEESVAFLEGIEVMPECSMLGSELEVFEIEVMIVVEIFDLEGGDHGAKSKL